MLSTNDTLEMEILGILQEEAAEVIQEVSKVRRCSLDYCRNGKDITSRRHLEQEILDFCILLEAAVRQGIVFTGEGEEWIDDYIEMKKEKLAKWSHIPQSLLENI